MEQASNSNYTMRIADRGRIVYYKQRADSAYWDAHWEDSIRRESYENALQGGLGWFEEVFSRHLPKQEPIIEAGCGIGQFVVALRKRGYSVEGIDWGRRTVEKVLELFPDLPIRCGDVCAMDVPDDYYGAYISLGVVEHRAEGPEPFLDEAFRVLRPGGLALISVPWYNPIRRIKAWAGLIRANGALENLEFYQYAYRACEMRNYLSDAGFRVINARSFNLQMGFEDELPFLASLYRIPTAGRLLKRLIRKGDIMSRICGHTKMFICEKPKRSPYCDSPASDSPC